MFGTRQHRGLSFTTQRRGKKPIGAWRNLSILTPSGSSGRSATRSTPSSTRRRNSRSAASAGGNAASSVSSLPAQASLQSKSGSRGASKNGSQSARKNGSQSARKSARRIPRPAPSVRQRGSRSAPSVRQRGSRSAPLPRRIPRPAPSVRQRGPRSAPLPRRRTPRRSQSKSASQGPSKNTPKSRSKKQRNRWNDVNLTKKERIYAERFIEKVSYERQRKIIEAMHKKENIGRIIQNKIPKFRKNPKNEKFRLEWIDIRKNRYYNKALKAFLKAEGYVRSRNGTYELASAKRKEKHEKLKKDNPAHDGQKMMYLVDSLGREQVYVNGRRRLTQREINERKQKMEANTEKMKTHYPSTSKDGTRMVWRKRESQKKPRKKASNGTLARIRKNQRQKKLERYEQLIKDKKVRRITIKRRGRDGRPLPDMYRYVGIVPKPGEKANEYLDEEIDEFIKRKKAALAKKYKVRKNAPDVELKRSQVAAKQQIFF